MEDKIFLTEQENIYWSSNFLYNKWYRKLYGGKWRLLKLGKDTPYIRLFAVWTKLPDSSWNGGYFDVVEIEEYPITNVKTKIGLFKEFFKQLIK